MNTKFENLKETLEMGNDAFIETYSLSKRRLIWLASASLMAMLIIGSFKFDNTICQVVLAIQLIYMVIFFITFGFRYWFKMVKSQLMTKIKE